MYTINIVTGCVHYLGGCGDERNRPNPDNWRSHGRYHDEAEAIVAGMNGSRMCQNCLKTNR